MITLDKVLPVWNLQHQTHTSKFEHEKQILYNSVLSLWQYLYWHFVKKKKLGIICIGTKVSWLYLVGKTKYSEINVHTGELQISLALWGLYYLFFSSQKTPKLKSPEWDLHCGDYSFYCRNILSQTDVILQPCL